MALSDLVVRQAKATGKAYTLPDIDGLSLAVTATGSKSWHFRYYWMKEPKRMSLGTYPEVSLREARALRDEARALVAKDINPRLHRHRGGSQHLFPGCLRLSHINRPAGRWMLTLDFRHVRRNILQSLARISSSEAA